MKNIRFILFTLMMAAFAFECKKDSGPSDTGGGALTEQEKQAIIQTYGTIASTANSLLKSDDPIAGFQTMVASYRSHASVENAWVTDDALYVKFKKSATVSWYVGPGVTIPPYGRGFTLPSKGLPPVMKPSASAANIVCLINQLSKDESRSVYQDYLSSLKLKLEGSGFIVAIANGNFADVRFFKEDLKNFGAIFFVGHGDYQTNLGVTWLNTGQEVPGNNDEERMGWLQRTFQNESIAHQVTIGTVKETRGGIEREVTYYKVSDRFIESSYASGDFPGSVIYLATCQGMKDPNRAMAQTFVRKGAGAVIGWDEKHGIGPHTGRLLFEFLLCGKKLFGAIQALPREAKTDRSIGVRADLIYYPPAAGDFRLVANERRATLEMMRPKKDSIYTTRNLQLEGRLLSGDSISLGTVELNAVAVPLALLSDRKSFSQSIVIKSGTNTNHITGIVSQRDGTCACVDTAYTFRGNFDPLELWTELRWNTDNSDVDFHLLPPGASFPASFWTTTDCYYGNRTTSWGGFLDVDDVNGRGPEHITIPTVTSQGVYRLFVHYYSAHGAGATSAYVSVSVRNGPNEEFGPLSLSRSASRGGDVWEVCTITYPAGTVTRVMRKTTLPGLDGGTSLVRSAKK